MCRCCLLASQVFAKENVVSVHKGPAIRLCTNLLQGKHLLEKPIESLVWDILVVLIKRRQAPLRKNLPCIGPDARSGPESKACRFACSPAALPVLEDTSSSNTPKKAASMPSVLSAPANMERMIEQSAPAAALNLNFLPTFGGPSPPTSAGSSPLHPQSQAFSASQPSALRPPRPE